MCNDCDQDKSYGPYCRGYIDITYSACAPLAPTLAALATTPAALASILVSQPATPALALTPAPLDPVPLALPPDPVSPLQ